MKMSSRKMSLKGQKQSTKVKNNAAIFIVWTLILFLSCCAHQPPQIETSFEEVVASLNSPQLIDEYQRKHFRSRHKHEGGGCGEVDIGITLEGCTPSFIYDNNKRGNCGAYTVFAVHCLRKAGHEAYPLYIYRDWGTFAPGHSPRDYHVMTLYKDDGKWFTLDNGARRGPEGIKGPYTDIEDLPYQVLKIDRSY
jgi:hypothetical protein